MRTPFGKGMESTFDFQATRIPQLKTKQRIGLQNKPEQTYDRDFVLSFHGGTRARSYNTIMYKAVHMTYEASPSRHSQGLFKTLRDHFKPTVDRRTTRRRTPISYHTSVGKIS